MANLILWNVYNNSDSYTRTVSCYQLASWLRQHGYTVKVIDFCHLMTTAELAAITEKYIGSDTLAVGVSSTFWTSLSKFGTEFHIEPGWVADARTALSNKKVYWLMGGSKTMVYNLKFEWIKFHGFAEDQLLKWMDENSSKLVRRDLYDIKDSALFFSEYDYIQPQETLPIELGRGCQFKCTFCSYPLVGKQKGTYIRDYDLIREEFIRNYNEYGTTRYHFLDDTVNESDEKIYALADIVQKLPFKLEWIGYNRADLIWSKPGTMQALKDSGLRSAFFGVESFHPTAARVVGKGWSGKQGKDFLLKLKDEWKNEISYCLSFIIGLPGEDRDSIMSTHQWCIDNDIDQWSFVPLHINPTGRKVWKSKFDMEYETYGYSFPDGTVNWKNELWTHSEATILSEELEKSLHDYIRPTTTLLLSLTSLGYPIDKLMNTRKIDLDWNNIRQRVNENIRNYVEFQLR